MGGPPGDRPRGPPRFDGDRPRFGDREGYRAGPVDLLMSLVVRARLKKWEVVNQYYIIYIAPMLY